MGIKDSVKGSKYCRTYAWNEKNQLISSVDSNYNTAYIYGQDGQRSNKYTANSETLYFNKMWTLHTDSGNNIYGGQTAKNIYLGETRIVTKLNSGTNPTYQEEYYKQYYYHSDHLGSASLISDYKGDEYQRIEYTPHGETWVEKTQNQGLEFLPYKFTAKELDEETGLYYYGARYLDPRYSRWISTDPALGEYIPKAPIDEEAKKYNQNLPGMGGVFNHINANLYHYAGNNPIKYTDPDGNFFIPPQVIAFGIGALIGAGTEFIWQLVENEGDISKIDGSAIFWSGLSGGASAFMATTGFGLGGQIIANTVINSLAELGHQLTDKEKGIDGFEILGAAIGGAVAGWVGGPGNKDISSQTNRLIKRVGNALKHGNYNEVGKALVYFQKMTKTFSKMMTKEQLKDAVKHFIPDKLLEDTVNEIFDAYKKAREEE